MRTLFTLFDSYEEAKEAIQSLLEANFDEKAMNVIVREEIAKKKMEVNLHAVDVKKSDEVDGVTVEGMAQLLGGEQPVELPGVGAVLAAGELATNAARTASASAAADVGLKAALQELDVPRDVAERYRQGINEGGVLLWVRTEDERAPAAASALQKESDVEVNDYSGNAPIR